MLFIAKYKYNPQKNHVLCDHLPLDIPTPLMAILSPL